MSKIRSTETQPERMLRKALRDAGLTGYRKNWRKAFGRPDVAFVGKKVAVFVDGDFWHGRLKAPEQNREFWQAKFRRNVRRDHNVTLTLAIQGWCVIRLWESSVRFDAANEAQRVRAIMEREGRL